MQDLTTAQIDSSYAFKAGDAAWMDEKDADILNQSYLELLRGEGTKIKSLDDLWK